MQLTLAADRSADFNASDVSLKLAGLCEVHPDAVSIDASRPDAIVATVHTQETQAGVDAQARTIAARLAHVPVAELSTVLAVPLSEPPVIAIAWNVRVQMPPGVCFSPQIVATLLTAEQRKATQLQPEEGSTATGTPQLQRRLATLLSVHEDQVSLNSTTVRGTDHLVVATIDVTPLGCAVATDESFDRLNTMLNTLSRPKSWLDQRLGVSLQERPALEPVLRFHFYPSPPSKPAPLPLAPPTAPLTTEALESPQPGAGWVLYAVPAAALLIMLLGMAVACHLHRMRTLLKLSDQETDRRFHLNHRTTAWRPERTYACCTLSAVRTLPGPEADASARRPLL